jgi:hypothetical protein
MPPNKLLFGDVYFQLETRSYGLREKVCAASRKL